MTGGNASELACRPIGDAGAATAVARHLARMAEGLGAAALVGRGSRGRWTGAAAEACLLVLDTHPERFRAAAEAAGTVAHAMDRHAEALAEAQVLMRRAAVQAISSPDAAPVLVERAVTIAAESAAGAARVIDAAATAAPPRRPEGFLARLDGWRAELQLGAGQATHGVASLLVRFNTLRFWGDPGGAAADVSATVGAVREAARHPAGTARAALDWQTWRTNPARAAGRLLPDLVAALLTGGAAAAARSATVATRMKAAATRALAADVARREQAKITAASARSRLVTTAIRTGPDLPDAKPWRGQGGVQMSAESSAWADAFWRLSVGAEQGITERMRVTVAAAGGRLVGLEFRRKHVDSLKRKLVTDADRRRLTLPEALYEAHDTVRYTVVLDDQAYVRGVTDTVARLDRSGLHTVDVRNAWYSGRYRGINTTWMDPASGASFEVQFHTPMSWEITKLTHPWYEEMRLPATAPGRKAELRAMIAAEYGRAARPEAVDSLTRESVRVPSTPAPIVEPPDLTVSAGAAGGVVSAGSGIQGAPAPAPQRDRGP